MCQQGTHAPQQRASLKASPSHDHSRTNRPSLVPSSARRRHSCSSATSTHHATSSSPNSASRSNFSMAIRRTTERSGATTRGSHYNSFVSLCSLPISGGGESAIRVDHGRYRGRNQGTLRRVPGGGCTFSSDAQETAVGRSEFHCSKPRQKPHTVCGSGRLRLRDNSATIDRAD